MGWRYVSNQWGRLGYLKKINPQSIKDLRIKINQDEPQKAVCQVR